NVARGVPIRGYPERNMLLLLALRQRQSTERKVKGALILLHLFRETFQHHPNSSDTDTGFTTADGSLIVLAETAAEAQPGEGPLHDPAFLQQHKSLGPKIGRASCRERG